MEQYKKEFIEFLLSNHALKFGEFTLKSGRKSPYFLNTGMLFDSKSIALLGKFYARAIEDNIKNYNLVFGPAYKGIPLAIATTISLYSDFQKSINYSFNRKEAKTHGDKGVIVGKFPEKTDNIVIVDDVITAGTAIRESLSLMDSYNIKPLAAIISVDRMEKGQGDLSAIQELKKEYNLEVFSIVTIKEIIKYLNLSNNKILTKQLEEKFQTYFSRYGVQ